MPNRPHRYCGAGYLHFITTSCYQRRALLGSRHTGRPLGSPEFVARLEQSILRSLAPRKPGRPKKPSPDPHQRDFGFAA